MNISLVRRSTSALMIALFAALSSSCAVEGGGGGYGYDGGDVGIGIGYYEPYGNYYGGWGSGYRVGPYRGGDHRNDGHHDDHGHGRPPQHSYRSAPASRSMPSIPSHAHSGSPRGH